jgi:glycosyltransferase involved in cell wall biosynthesis
MTEQPRLDAVAAELRDLGVRRVHSLAWRDLDDPDAGGSEVHADEFARRWAAAGLDVVHRTSGIEGRTSRDQRNGYEVRRAGGRLTVFPRAVLAEVFRRMGPYDAIVEIWNGVPWFSPVWCRRPHLAFLHHVHGPMWDQILPGPLASFGRHLEATIAPPFYRSSLTMTPSSGTREELIELGFRPERVIAVENGVDDFFRPGGQRAEAPTVLAVGRLAPVKRFELLIDSVVEAHRQVPGLVLEIIGDGPLAAALRERVTTAGAGDYVRFLGHVAREDLVAAYQRAWVVSSASLAEGWGLALTEGAACGTPAVATDIRGHRSSVVDGVTGILAQPDHLAGALVQVLTDHDLRRRLGRAAQERARTLTWDRVALEMAIALRDEAARTAGRRG